MRDETDVEAQSETATPGRHKGVGSSAQTTGQWSVLLDMGRAVQGIAEIGDLERVVRVLFERMGAVGLDFAGLDFQRLIDADTQTFEVHGVRPNGTYRRFTVSRKSTFDEWQRNRVLYRRDLSRPEHRVGLADDYQGAYGSLGIQVRCILHVPNRYGLLTLRSETPNAFSDPEVSFVRDLAEMLDLGISRVEDLERLAAKNDELVRANEALSGQIAERLQAEEALRESERYLARAQEIACVGHWKLDPETHQVTGSDELFRIFGLRRDEATLDAFAGVVHPEDRNYDLHHITRGMTHGESWDIEHRLICRDGAEKTVRAIGEAVVDGSGKTVELVGTVQDITGQKQAEAEVRRAHNLESLGILAGGIAHDFNNVLTGVLGNLQLLQISLDEGSDEHRMATAAIDSAARTRALTAQLMTFARGGAPVKETAAIGELVRKTTDLTLSGSNTRPHYEFPAGLSSVDLDVGQISQVVQNLVLNADQAMPEGGTLRISAENVEVPDGSLLPLEAGSYVKVSVADEGIGIPQDLVPKIFDPYLTTKEAGHGLGLAIAYSIIGRHDGHIAARSEQGVGTTFDFYLPASSEQPGTAVERSRELAGGEGRILLMDDEETIRETVGKMLERLGYEVNTACDGSEALRAFRAALEADHPYDLAILDLTVPGGMGGREAASELRDLHPEARLIVSSGYANDPVMADCRAHGFHDRVTKPVRIEELAAAVRGVLRDSEN